MAPNAGYGLFRILMILAAAMEAVGLKCYESVCLYEGLARCPEDTRAVLKECNLQAFIGVVRAINASTLSKSIEYNLVCGKLGEEGEKPERPSPVVRMCHPNVLGLCESLQNYTVRVYRRQLYGHYLDVVHGCSFCDTDGCNLATKMAGAAILVAQLAAAAVVHLVCR